MHVYGGITLNLLRLFTLKFCKQPSFKSRSPSFIAQLIPYFCYQRVHHDNWCHFLFHFFLIKMESLRVQRRLHANDSLDKLLTLVSNSLY